MQHRLLIPLLCSFAGVAQVAHAEPPVIDKSQAVAEPRRDAGSGICGSVIHFKDQAMPLSMKDKAVDLLNRPSTDPEIMGRTSRIFDNINFRNGQPTAIGDFTAPSFRDEIFPYSAHPMAVPPGDDKNIALRLRGYLNVPTSLAGKVVTFAVNCDDFCALRIGKIDVVPFADERISARKIKQAKFQDAGMYPVELVYYQNGSIGFLEWARSDEALAECPNDTCRVPLTDLMYNDKFRTVQLTDLYSSVVGRNDSCQECGAPGQDCSTGNFCGDGLCQTCNVPQHCGTDCRACPANASICSLGKCVQCTADDQCPIGSACDVVNGKCNPPTPCTRNDQCPMGQVCDPDTNLCSNPPAPCVNDTSCPAGQICHPDRKTCYTPPKKCTVDADCPNPAYQYCDVGEKICKPRLTKHYVGGQAGCSLGSASTNSGNGAGMVALFGMLLAGLAFVGRRRLAHGTAAGTQLSLRNRSGIQKAALLLPVFFCAIASTAHAQSDGISLNAQNFRPAIGPENIITVEGTRTSGRWVPMANVLIEYAHRPLRLLDTANNMTVADTVPQMLTLHLSGGIGLTKWLSLGVDLPVVIYQGFERQNTPLSDVPIEPSSAGLGDLRLVGKARIIDNTDGGFGLAFVPQIMFPTGKGEEFRGDSAFGFEPRLAVDYRTKGGFIVALNASVLLRTEDQLARNVRVSHQVRYGLGAFLPLPKGFGLAGELTGATSMFNAESIYTPLEAYLAARWIHSTGINVNIGGGPGITPVAGSPQFRMFASIGYLPMARKKEVVRQKPTVVDLDPDRDGLIGDKDRCPEVFGPPENQGCPDVDTDKDGLVDRLDACPNEPGPKENNGCPDKDRDGDGLVDRLDSCPDQPGPLENNGCPLPDTDKDGLVDKDDKCPYEPGPKENNGCPPPRKFISVEEGEIKLLQQIQFATNKALINGKPSFELLDEVVSVLKARPTMRVHIEGHTDSRGKLAWNMQLSKNRADVVRKYLADKGVEGERLTAEGYGPSRPLCPEKTASCYDKNRRTQFKITQQ